MSTWARVRSQGVAPAQLLPAPGWGGHAVRALGEHSRHLPLPTPHPALLLSAVCLISPLPAGNRVLKQQQEVLGYDGSQYLSRLVWATSTPSSHSSTNGSSGGGGSSTGTTGDSVQVPISLAYRADRVALDGSDPLLLEAYGAYGASSDPDFSGQCGVQAARFRVLSGVVF